MVVVRRETPLGDQRVTQQAGLPGHRLRARPRLRGDGPRRDGRPHRPPQAGRRSGRGRHHLVRRERALRRPVVPPPARPRPRAPAPGQGAHVQRDGPPVVHPARPLLLDAEAELPAAAPAGVLLPLHRQPVHRQLLAAGIAGHPLLVPRRPEPQIAPAHLRAERTRRHRRGHERVLPVAPAAAGRGRGAQPALRIDPGAQQVRAVPSLARGRRATGSSRRCRRVGRRCSSRISGWSRSDRTGAGSCCECPRRTSSRCRPCSAATSTRPPRGAAAREAWLQWFAPDVCFTTAVDAAAAVLDTSSPADGWRRCLSSLEEARVRLRYELKATIVKGRALATRR